MVYSILSPGLCAGQLRLRVGAAPVPQHHPGRHCGQPRGGVRPPAPEDVQTGEVHVQHHFLLCAILKHKN